MDANVFTCTAQFEQPTCSSHTARPHAFLLSRQFDMFRTVIALLCCWVVTPSMASENRDIVNPHWTGRHCAECHLEKDPRVSGAALRFNGDGIALCNRCHELENVRTDNHPVGVALLEEMKDTVPETFSLDNGQLTCLTCHDALLQMYDDFVLRQSNRNFVRGAPYEELATFCFFCHKREEYKKTNPHEQLDETGHIVESRCLFCHQSVPDPGRVRDISEVTFKTSLSLYCVNCHFQQKMKHPARADHLVPLPDFIQGRLTEGLQAQDAELPLDGDRIFCGTCHNPHAKGVIQRREAAAGAGEEYFLRLNGGYQLCVTCHNDKLISRQSEATIRREEGPPGLPQKIISSHKPAAENKCKNCHSITPELRDRPQALKLCFTTDCHTTELLNQEFVHEIRVAENCYLCHLSHSSTYEKLLRMEKQQLCRSCHPLMHDRTGRFTDRKQNDTAAPAAAAAAKVDPSQGSENASVSRREFEKSSKEHTVFGEYVLSAQVARDRACGFCHSFDHQKALDTLSMEVCSRCHTFVRDMVAGASDVPLNIHDTFQEKSCTACHDPHAAPHRYVLKKPAETYRSQ